MAFPDISSFPHTPGVYLFRDAKGKIVYVGKSVNLRSRVGSYFQGADLGAAKNRLVKIVVTADWVEVHNETEALILETNLIKRHSPKFNVLMKDDKNLSYIAFTKESIPEILRTRQRGMSGVKYYGPYAQSVDIGTLLRTVRRVFRIRSCRVKFGKDEKGELRITAKAGRSIPCMDHYIGLCPAPCTLDPQKITLHLENISRAQEFFAGKTSHIAAELESKMKILAAEKRFEDAATTKREWEQVKLLADRQGVRDMVSGNHDAVVFLSKYGRFFAGVAEVRDGMLVGMWRWEITHTLEESDQELAEEFLARRYAAEVDGMIQNKNITVLLPSDVILGKGIGGLFSQENIAVEHPAMGAKSDLLSFAKNDLLNWAMRQEMASIGKKSLSRATAVSLMKKLGFSAPPKGEIVMECYDISHLQGQYTVASRSVMVNGKAVPSRYRKYKVRTMAPGQIDDFASLREVLGRRTREGLEQGNFPTFFVIDGGKGQLSSALSAMGAENVSKIPRENTENPLPILPPICSLAKREEEVFVPHQNTPIILEKGSPELMLLQKARDEAHRFALSFHRKSRNKALTKNILDEIPGIGIATRRALLKAAGSVDGISRLAETELTSLTTAPQRQALRDHGIL